MNESEEGSEEGTGTEEVEESGSGAEYTNTEDGRTGTKSFDNSGINSRYDSKSGYNSKDVYNDRGKGNVKLKVEIEDRKQRSESNLSDG